MSLYLVNTTSFLKRLRLRLRTRHLGMLQKTWLTKFNFTSPSVVNCSPKPHSFPLLSSLYLPHSGGGLHDIHRRLGGSPNWQMYLLRVLQRWSFQLKALAACISTQFPKLWTQRREGHPVVKTGHYKQKAKLLGRVENYKGQMKIVIYQCIPLIPAFELETKSTGKSNFFSMYSMKVFFFNCWSGLRSEHLKYFLSFSTHHPILTHTHTHTHCEGTL